MPRVKRGAKRAHKRKKVLKLSSGFYGTKSNAYRMAMQAVDRAGKFATRDRRQKKRQFRSLWIVRINAAARENNFTYRQLIQGLKLACIEIDRKQLAEMAIADPAAFTVVVDQARKAVEAAAKA